MPRTHKKKTEPFRFAVQTLRLEEGTILFRDSVRQTLYETVISPTSLELTNFTTLGPDKANYNLTLKLEQDAELQMSGALAVMPFMLEGELSLTQFSLESLYRYFSEPLAFVAEQGQLQLESQFLIEQSLSGPSHVAMQLTDFEIRDAVQDKILLAGEKLSLSNGQLLYPEGNFRAYAVTLQAGYIGLELNQDKQLDMLEVMKDSWLTTPSETAKTESA